MQLIPQRLKRESTGDAQPSKTTIDEDRVGDVEETVRPHSRDDPTATSWRERLADSRGTLIALSTIAVLSVIVLGFWLRDFFFDVLTNIWTQRAVAALVLLGVGYRGGWNQKRATVEGTDWLVLRKPDDAVRYKGEYKQVRGETGRVVPVFIPYTGFKSYLGSPRPLTHGELGAELTRVRGQVIDEDEPVAIGLELVDPDVARTDDGTIVTAFSAGLSVHPWSEHSSVFAEKPEAADLEQYRELADELDHVRNDEMPRLQRRVNTLETQVQELLERVEETRTEQIEELQDLAEIVRGPVPGARRREDGQQGRGPERPLTDTKNGVAPSTEGSQ